MTTIITELKHALLSKRFLLTVPAIVILSLCSLISEIRTIPDSSVYYLYMVYFYYPMWMIVFVLAPIPGASTFCLDWNTKMYRLKVIRSGKRPYVLAKILVTWLTSFLAVFLSQTLLLLLLAGTHPVLHPGDGNALQGGIYQAYLNTSGIWVYFMSKAFFLSAGVSFFSVFALWISEKIPDKLLNVTAPIIGYYLVDNLTAWLRLPAVLSVPHLIKGNIEVAKGVGYTWLYVGGMFGLFSLVFGYFFFRNCIRKMEND